MFKTITSKNEYEMNPTLSTSAIDDVCVTLFGKEYFFHKDRWMRNVHLKITDRCNARCWFCVERDSCIPCVRDAFMYSLKSLLRQMSEQETLYTVTITGGEPSMCEYLQDILDEVARYDVFLTLNTNGRSFPAIKNSPAWINISKHAVDDKRIVGLPSLGVDDILMVRKNTGSKIRLQSVLTHGGLDSVEKILRYMDVYKSVVDDFSFRQLISGSVIGTCQPSLVPFRKYLYDVAELVEQVFQDYYVYETWVLDGVRITLSFSDMEMLERSEKTESGAMLREIIIHPDGMVTGDWGRKTKIIYEPTMCR